MVAVSGALVSTFIASSASSGIVYTLKALIVIIVGGPGRMAGAIAAGLLLGVAEQVVDISSILASRWPSTIAISDSGSPDQADGIVRPWLTGRSR